MPALFSPRSAQIVEVGDYHGRKGQCVQSGIVTTNGTACGTQQYAMVFRGTVKSAFDIGETDKLLPLVQDEVFRGDSVTEVMSVTNQACLRPEIRGWRKWPGVAV